MDPTDDAGLGALLTTTREGESDVSLLSMTGKDDKVMLGAIIVPGDGQTWFVKATTDGARADALRADFAAFAKSFRRDSGAPRAATPPSGAQPTGGISATSPSAEAVGGIDARLAHFAPPSGWSKESTGGNIVAAAFVREVAQGAKP